jgi:hypothetical protein
MGVVKPLCAAVITLAMSVETVVALGQNIKGKVTQSSDHSPVAGAKVSIDGKPQLAAITRVDGSYIIQNISTGVYRLIADNPRFWPSVKDNVSTGGSANFELVEKRYLRNEAMKMVYADVSADVARRLLPIAKTAADNEAVYLLSERLRLEHPEDKALEQQSANAETDLNRQRATIVGSVVDGSGNSVRNADVKLTNDATGVVVATKTNDRGQYEASVFPVGTYKVEVASPGDSKLAANTKVAVRPNVTVNTNLTVH